MSAPPPMRTVGGYELLHEIGRGGMAVVYLARQIDLDRLVALKELGAFHADDPASARRFLNESRLAGSLTHANIVTVHEYFEHARLPYISMEYVRGGSLRPLVGHLTPPQAIGVLVGVLNGLTWAEKHHIVHRDLKPENLMLGDDGNVKIADFGIAKAINRVTMLGVHTATGTTVGTPDYMAPEQAVGQSVTSATDRYALGVIAYELLTGRKPFEGDTPLSVLFKHVNDPLPPPRSVNPELDAGLADWIARLLEKEPEERIPSARQALEELEDIAIRLHGPRWRRLAALPAAEATESTSRDRSMVYITFDPGRAAAGAVDEVPEPVGPGPGGGVPATTGAGETAGPPVEEAEPPGEVAEEAALTEPEPRDAEGATIPPRGALPPTPLGEPVEKGAARRQRTPPPVPEPEVRSERDASLLDQRPVAAPTSAPSATPVGEPAEAIPSRPRRHRRWTWLWLPVAAALCAAVALTLLTPSKPSQSPLIPVPRWVRYEPKSRAYSTSRPSGDGWTVICNDQAQACAGTPLFGARETRFTTVGMGLTIDRQQTKDSAQSLANGEAQQGGQFGGFKLIRSAPVALGSRPGWWKLTYTTDGVADNPPAVVVFALSAGSHGFVVKAEAPTVAAADVLASHVATALRPRS